MACNADFSDSVHSALRSCRHFDDAEVVSDVDCARFEALRIVFEELPSHSTESGAVDHELGVLKTGTEAASLRFWAGLRAFASAGA